MGFEVYVQRFESGEKANFARSQVEAILGPRMAPHAPGERVIELLYPTGSGGLLFIKADAEINAFTVKDPGVEELFDDLFALMKAAGLVLYWPDRAPSLAIVDEEVRAELPASMIETLGPGIVVGSGRDIIAAIKSEV